MSVWKSVGIGAAIGAGLSALLRALGRGETPWEPTEDDGVLEEREAAPAMSGGAVAGRKLVESLGQRAGMTPEQIQFLVFVAWGESKFFPNVGRGDPALRPPGLRKFYTLPTEAVAAQKAYARNARVFEDCGHEASAYGFGSGGLFAFLPTYPLFHLRGTPLRCAHPYEVFDAAFSMTAAYSFARSLTRHPAFDGTVVELRAGWGALRSMKDPNYYAGKLSHWRAQLKLLGIDEGWLFAPAPSFPKRDLLQLYHAMGGRLARSVA